MKIMKQTSNPVWPCWPISLGWNIGVWRLVGRVCLVSRCFSPSGRSLGGLWRASSSPLFRVPSRTWIFLVQRRMSLDSQQLRLGCGLKSRRKFRIVYRHAPVSGDWQLWSSYIYIYMGARQNRRSGTSSGTTPVPYPRSIPPFHTSLKDPFHTSVPYLWSIHYNIYICIYIYICLYICIYIYMCVYVFIYIHLNMCSLILHLYAHTWAHIHTWVCTCKNRFTMPKPCDCVGKSVPAAFVVWW